MLDHAVPACDELGNGRLAIGDPPNTGPVGGPFDLARLLLASAPDPMTVPCEAVAIVGPAGTVVAQEADWLSWRYEPDIQAWATLRAVLLALSDAQGSIRASAAASRRCCDE
jgi:hypothetical protein